VAKRLFTRRALVRGAAGAAAGAMLVRGTARAVAAAPSAAPRLSRLGVTNGGLPFAGDGRMVATVSRAPGAARPAAHVQFVLDRPASVLIEAISTRRTFEPPVWRATRRFGKGRHTVAWRPARDVPAQTYLMRLTVTDKRGKRRVYGANRPAATWVPPAPVVRVLGVEGAFTKRSYAPGQRSDLRLATDAGSVTLQMFRSGTDPAGSARRGELPGVPVTEPVTLAWHRHRNRPGTISQRVGDWGSGLYHARLTADDGRVGYAPFVVRPQTPSTRRAAVVMPTNTWQAYNFRDADGDGWGDTWYAGGNPPVDLTRAHLDRGVPFRFGRYDLPFLRWLAQSGHEADYLAEEDVERFRTGDRLRAAYDLVVYPGHTEYVTEREYDVVERYRDLGGSLMFLSANNFFWRVDRRGRRLVRTQLWRALGRPEARLVGVQYLANDDGSLQDAYTVTDRDAAPWLFEGTRLENGSRFGHYGIEIDARTKDSPPGTVVLATITELFGPGKTAEMTYYETAAGARVFAAGVLTFGGSAGRWAVGRMLDNLWRRMTAPPPI
jgi:hypothetical protein